MPHSLIFSQSDYLILDFDTNSHTKRQTVQIQIIWLLQKPTDLALHCLQRQGIIGFSRTRVKKAFTNYIFPKFSIHRVHSNLIILFPLKLIMVMLFFSLCNRKFFRQLLTLTLKAPRKTASENVVCLCRLLNILADFSNLFLHTGKQYGPRSD